ncbi:uncharacterized protein [Apostichopus japonicus]|uniref:uncharacterized protein isoform X2 n=1 Tax=Stichopus japonicus TaxID=307972 RepID=UPI003AB27E74
MASHLYLVLLAAVVALCNGLKCNNRLSLTCGEHSDANDEQCGLWEKMGYGAGDDATLKCPESGGMNKCATGDIQYKQTAANFSVKVSFASCGKGEIKCFTDLQELGDNELGTGLSLVLKGLDTLTAGETKICFCDKDLCNSALSMIAHTSVVVISLVLIIML